MKRILLLLSIVTLLISCSDDEIYEPTIESLIPEIRTKEVTGISIYSMTLEGKILKIGNTEIMEVGFVIGMTTNPTLLENINKFSTEVNDLNEFNVTITSIPPNTTFYIRAYGINSDGIGYGNEVVLTSLKENVYNNNVILSTQDEVIEFGSNNYTTIGSLTINGSVTDLTPLNSLVIINSEFNVVNTTHLKDFKGLENLKIVGNIFPNGFDIKYNKVLENFSGLSGLEISRGEFYISNNNALINFNGFDSYFAVSAGSLVINNCDNLSSLSGFEKLQFIGDSFGLGNNPKLDDISSLSNLSYIDRHIDIQGNKLLQNLNGLENITDLDNLTLTNNESLNDLNGITNLKSLQLFKLEGNKSLINLPEFKYLEKIGGIKITYGGSLLDLKGFKYLKSIGSLNFYQSDISSLNGLDQLKDIEYILEITSCKNLKNLQGLENLTSSGGIAIYQNPNIYDLDGLQNLTEIKDQGLSILSNESLSNLNGLNNLKTISGSFGISYNQSLTNIDAIDHIESCKNFLVEGNKNFTKLPSFINLTSLDYVSIINGSRLSNLKGFESLLNIKNLHISDSELQSLEGLENLESIDDLITIKNCDKIVDLKGLDKLKTIGNGYNSSGINFESNFNLINLNGILSLTDLNGSLLIYKNQSLMNLNGLEILTNITHDIAINGNNSLSDFCSLNPYLSNYSFTGNYMVIYNNLNPTLNEIIDNCD